MIANFHETFVKVKDILVVVAIPLIFTLLFGFVYSNIYVEDIPFAVLDLDETSSSRMIIDNFTNSGGLDVVGNVSSQEELQDMILSRQVYGGLIIPDNFEKDIQAKQGPSLLVWIDGSNIVIGNNIYSYTSTVINMLGAGVQMNILEGGSIVPYTAEQYLNTMTFTDRMLYDPQLGYMRYVFAGLLGIMIQQTYLSVLSSRLLQEKFRLTAVAGNSSRQDKLPVGFPDGNILLSIGRLICLSTISFFLCLLTANRFYDYPLRGSVWELLALIVLFLVNMTAMGLLITSFFDDEAHCAQFCMFLSVPTFLTSGYVWPEFMMAPHFASVIKSIWPLYYLVNPLRNVCMKNADFTDIAPYLSSGILFGALWLTVTVLLFRYRIRLMRRVRAQQSAQVQPNQERMIA